jgi:hypothetical protein
MRGKMEIPKTVRIIDSVITVEIGTVACAIGFSDYQNNKIIIDPTVSDSMKQEIFYHELVHWILFKMHNKLEADERFVGLFGSLLNQSLTSAGIKLQQED